MKTSGRIIEQHKQYCVVDVHGETMQCFVRGGLRKREKAFAGDIVDIEIIESSDKKAFITHIHPRRNVLDRPPVANIDSLIAVMSVADPPVDRTMLDRCLVSAEFHGISPCVLFNKIDLLDNTTELTFRDLTQVYSALGYPVLEVSAQSGAGINDIAGVCQTGITCLSGPSGVGKTSILNSLFPGCKLKISTISYRIGRGTHTTTSVTLLPLSRGGLIADTPGYSVLDLPFMDEEDLPNYFPEIRLLTGQCGFNNCRHLDEPDCAVHRAIASGCIAAWRYEHYRMFYRECARQRRGFRRGIGRAGKKRGISRKRKRAMK